MNREFLFRGKCGKSDKWAYGSLWDGETDRPDRTDAVIIPKRLTADAVNVDPYTVGQYTGLKDKNGVKIFEGDILEVKRSLLLGKTLVGEIIWQSGGFWFYFKHPLRDGYGTLGLEPLCNQGAVVIGNRHDTPELLEANNE